MESKLGRTVEPDGAGLGLSLETGYSFKLGNGIVIEPQAQIVYQYTNFDDIHNNDGSTVWFDDGDSLAGRIGLRISRDWATEGSMFQNISTWGRVNVWHEFMGENKVSFSSLNGPVGFTSDMGDTWAELQAGVSAHVTESASVFVSGGYDIAFDGDSRGYNGKVGLKVTW